MARWTRTFCTFEVGFGDHGLALKHDQPLQSPFYYVDGGAGKFALGECSHKVATNLGVTRVAGTPCTWNNNFPVQLHGFSTLRRHAL